MKKIKMKQTRPFKPYHDLLGAAAMALDDAKDKRRGSYYSQMIAITFSALAIEALANSFGDHFINKWEDYESASPIAKLRVICSYFKITIDFTYKPWSTLLWLKKFRNKIGHAKPELIKLGEIMTEKRFEKIRYKTPKSKLDEYITLPKAKEAYESVDQIKDILCNKIPEDQKGDFLSESWSGETSLVQKTNINP